MGKDDKEQLPAKEMDDINDDQEAKIAAFTTDVWAPMRAAREAWLAAKDADPEAATPDGDTMLLPSLYALSDADRRITCYKFLVARQWDATKAEEMLRATCKFKHDRQLETRPTFPSPVRVRGWDLAELKAFHGEAGEDRPANMPCDTVHSHITPYYQGTYHKWDKWGHPVFLEATGNINVTGLTAKLKQLASVGETPDVPMVDYHIHFNEVGGRLVRYNDAMHGPKHDRRVLGVVAILDCKGLGMGHLYTPALDVLKKVWACDSSYYPEGLHALYAVNCPGMIMFAYNIVKGWLDPRVRAKVRFVKPNETVETLLSMIDAEHLPVHLGGTCECEGGCIYGMDGSVAPPEEDPSTLSELFNVGSGKKVTRELAVGMEDVVVWEFVVADGRNVEFSALFIAEDEANDADQEEGGGGREVYLPSKQQQMDMRHVCEGKGTLRLTFSNEYSWVRSKDVTLRLFVTK